MLASARRIRRRRRRMQKRRTATAPPQARSVSSTAARSHQPGAGADRARPRRRQGGLDAEHGHHHVDHHGRADQHRRQMGGQHRQQVSAAERAHDKSGHEREQRAAPRQVSSPGPRLGDVLQEPRDSQSDHRRLGPNDAGNERGGDRRESEAEGSLDQRRQRRRGCHENGRHSRLTDKRPEHNPGL